MVCQAGAGETAGADAGCPLREILDQVGNKWSVLAVLVLNERTHRFGELRRRIEGISQRMLTETLRGLERDGLVHRRAIATVPVTVEYSLTDAGRTLIVPLSALAHWAEEYRPYIRRSQADFDARRAEEASSESRG
jgi:DNA-binding HxlR family transcriptional regulator